MKLRVQFLTHWGRHTLARASLDCRYLLSGPVHGDSENSDENSVFTSHNTQDWAFPCYSHGHSQCADGPSQRICPWLHDTIFNCHFSKIFTMAWSPWFNQPKAYFFKARNCWINVNGMISIDLACHCATNLKDVTVVLRFSSMALTYVSSTKISNLNSL